MLNVSLSPHRTNLRAGSAEAQKVFALLKLIPQADVAHARPPLAFTLVIDTSGSMREYADQEAARRMAPGQPEMDGLYDGCGVLGSLATQQYKILRLPLPTKLDQAIEACQKFVDDPNLPVDALVSVVQFDDDANVLLPLTAASSKTTIHQAINRLREHSGGTHLAKGLRCASSQLSSLPAQHAKRLLVFTDGHTFDEVDCLPLAQQLGAENNTIIAMGLGAEYNEDLLEQMAEQGRGRFLHLGQMGEMASFLKEELGTSVREVVTDLRAALSAVKGVSLDKLTRVYPSLVVVDTSQQPYRLGNVGAGDYSIFVLELTISGIQRPPSRVRVAQLGLTGSAPGLGLREEFPPFDLFLTFTTDEAAIAQVDEEILGYVQQISVDRMVKDAVRMATVDAGKARQTLVAARGLTQRVGNAPMTRMLDNALEELNQSGTISSNTAKTVRAGGRTKTVKTGSLASSLGGLPSDEEIRRMTGL